VRLKKKLGELLSLLAALGVFAALLLAPQAATDGARAGLHLCARTLIPALFRSRQHPTFCWRSARRSASAGR